MHLSPLWLSLVSVALHCSEAHKALLDPPDPALGLCLNITDFLHSFCALALRPFQQV